MIGISFTAMIGWLCRKLYSTAKKPIPNLAVLIFAGFFSGILYHLVVDIVDAYVYQPFWPRLIGGMLFSLITIVSNIIIFALLKQGLFFLYRQDKIGLNDA